MKLILIRHGETNYNLQKRYCGFSDPSLNETGLIQSQKLAKRFSNIQIDGIYSSDLLRTFETAKVVFGINRVKKLHIFREMNFGIFEGFTYSELEYLYPDLFRKWVEDPLNTIIHCGESIDIFVNRIITGLHFLLTIHKNQTIALITHGGPIRILLYYASSIKQAKEQNFNITRFWDIKQDLASVNIIDYSDNGLPKILEVNNTSHL